MLRKGSARMSPSNEMWASPASSSIMANNKWCCQGQLEAGGLDNGTIQVKVRLHYLAADIFDEFDFEFPHFHEKFRFRLCEERKWLGPRSSQRKLPVFQLNRHDRH